MSTTLTTLFGAHPDVLVLEFLAQHVGFDYNMSDVARNAGVSRPTAYKVVRRLERRGLVRRTRRVGTSWMFQLDATNPLVKPLLDFEVKLAESPPRARRRVAARGVRRS